MCNFCGESSSLRDEKRLIGAYSTGLYAETGSQNIDFVIYSQQFGCHIANPAISSARLRRSS